MNPNTNVNKNYQYYLDNQEEFNAKHLNKYIIIKDESIFGVYDNLEEVISAAKVLQAGTYIIQLCKKDSDIQTFHTRVRFNA